MEKKYSIESLDLMRAVQTYEKTKDRKVTSPGELFAIMLAMGYRRDPNRLNIQQQAREFMGRIKQGLIRAKRTAPTFDEVVNVMHSLGYRRSGKGIKNLVASW